MRARSSELIHNREKIDVSTTTLPLFPVIFQISFTIYFLSRQVRRTKLLFRWIHQLFARKPFKNQTNTRTAARLNMFHRALLANATLFTVRTIKHKLIKYAQ